MKTKYRGIDDGGGYGREGGRGGRVEMVKKRRGWRSGGEEQGGGGGSKHGGRSRQTSFWRVASLSLLVMSSRGCHAIR